jgi:hypothetical protein
MIASAALQPLTTSGTPSRWVRGALDRLQRHACKLKLSLFNGVGVRRPYHPYAQARAQTGVDFAEHRSELS